MSCPSSELDAVDRQFEPNPFRRLRLQRWRLCCGLIQIRHIKIRGSGDARAGGRGGGGELQGKLEGWL